MIDPKPGARRINRTAARTSSQQQEHYPLNVSRLAVSVARSSNRQIGAIHQERRLKSQQQNLYWYWLTVIRQNQQQPAAPTTVDVRPRPQPRTSPPRAPGQVPTSIPTSVLIVSIPFTVILASIGLVSHICAQCSEAISALLEFIHKRLIMPTERFVRVRRKAWMCGTGDQDSQQTQSNHQRTQQQPRRRHSSPERRLAQSESPISHARPLSSPIHMIRSASRDSEDGIISSGTTNVNNQATTSNNDTNAGIDILSRSSRIRLFMDNLMTIANWVNNNVEATTSSSSSSSSSNGSNSRSSDSASSNDSDSSNSNTTTNNNNNNNVDMDGVVDANAPFGRNRSYLRDNNNGRDHHQQDEDKKMFKFQMFKFSEVHPRSDKTPKARSGHRMVADDRGDLYSFGGFNQGVDKEDNELSEDPFWQVSRPLFRELWKFNWRPAKWEKLYTEGDVPEKLVSHCMGYFKDKLIIYGGTGTPFGQTSSNKLTIYHIKRNYWETIRPSSAPSLAPHEMYGQAMAIDENRGDIYIIGGTDGHHYSLDVHKFNLYSKKWTPLFRTIEFLDEYRPGFRYRHEIALYNNKLYLFGGGGVYLVNHLRRNICYSFKKLPVFDLETCDWSFLRTTPDRIGETDVFPEARKCHSLAVLDKDCYVCGGTGGEQICPNLWHIDLDTLKWTLLVPRIPYPVYFHAASVGLEGQLTIFGGVDHQDGKSRNNKLTTIWLRIPSLRTMCLLALRHYVHEKILDPQSVPWTGMGEANEVAS